MKKYIGFGVAFVAFIALSPVANAAVLYSQEISLSSGWNIVSTPRVLDSHTFSATENSTNFDIYVLDASQTSGWTTMANLGQSEFKPLYGYFINNKTGVDQTLTFNYKASTTPNERLFSRSFAATGWYSVGVANPTYGLPQGTGSGDTNNVANILFSLGTNYSQAVDFTLDAFSSDPDSVAIGATWDARTQSDANALHDLRETKAYAIYITNTAGLYTGFQNDSIPAPTECGDGVDNDGDGLIDYSNDPGCTSTNDSSEDTLPGTVTVAKASNSPSSNVASGASNVKWATFELTASKEDVKIESLGVIASTTLDHGLDNGKVFVDGVQVGSTKDLTDNADVNFTFGSSFIAKAGKVHIVDIYADAKSTTGAAYANGDTASITLGQGNANGQGNASLTLMTVPSSDVTANTLTISSGTLTATKYSGYGNQTIIAGTSNARLGSFTLSAGSAEGVNVNTITVNLSSDEAATITDLRLVDNATGVQIGTAKPSPSTSNSFSVNFDVAVSSTKTIDVVGNIKSGSNVGPWIAEIDTTSGGTGLSTGNSVTIGSTLMLQTITVGNGTLTQAAGTSPDDANVVAGSNDVKVGSFNFTASNSSFTIQELKVKIPANAATSVSSVTLKWAANPTGVSQALSVPAVGDPNTQATATFTGLTFAVPMNETKTIDVYVNIPTIANGATSGSAISALLDWNEGFKAVDSAGTASTTMASFADLNSAGSGKGTMYVRKSKPTIAAVTLDSTLTQGTDVVLGRWSVTADAAGKIDWGSVVITLSKTSALDIGATTTLAIWSGSNQIAGTFATTTGGLASGNDACDNLTSCLLHFRPTSVETIEAGSSKTYELRGTVGGIAAGANNISASIANPQTIASSTAIFSMVAGTQGESSAASFAWSDWSDLSDHSTNATGASAADWTGDYLVKSLPLTIGNRTMNF